MSTTSSSTSSREIPTGENKIGGKTKQSAIDDDTSITVSMTDLGSNDNIGSNRTSVLGTTFILLSEIMGTGVLGLPFVAVSLGWTATMISIPLFAIFAAYSGYQLRSVKVLLGEKSLNVSSFADAGRELIGSRFGTFTSFCMLLNWGALAIYMLIATSDGIANIYAEGFLSCNRNRTIIAALLLVIPAQARDFHTISKYLSLPSIVAIIITLIIIIVTLVEKLKTDNTTSFAQDTIVGVEPGMNVFDFLQSLSSIVFAYQGQSIFFELMSEMKNPKEFTKSSNLAYTIMACVYALIVIVAYGIEGENVADFLPASMNPGTAKTVVGVLIVFHIIVAYVIAIQPFHFWLHKVIFPKTFNSPSKQGQIHWLLITVGYVLFAWIVANIIPFFGALQALIGSLLGAPIVFGWPSLYYLLANKNKNGNSTWAETLRSVGLINSSISLVFLFIFTPLFCILGTWGGINSIIEDFSSSGSPFHC
jgi:amino acid permease